MAQFAVQPIGLRNLAVLRQAAHSLVPLSYPEIAFSNPNSGLLAALPGGRRHVRGLVASDGHLTGVIVLRPEPSDFRWAVVSLGATGDCGEGCVELWTALLAHSTVVAGLGGAKRLHVDAPLDGPVHDALIRAGFSVYAHETILLAQGLHPAEGEEISLRAQEPSDAWSVHHLYHSVTPRAIQYAEAYTSNHWHLSRRPWTSQRGYVLEGQQGLGGYCRITTCSRQAALEVMMAPEFLGDLPALVWRSLQDAGAGLETRVWVAIPDYHQEYLGLFETMGFQAAGRRSLMVRYTGITAAAPAPRRMALVSSVAERLPSRVPAPAGSNLRS